MIEIIIQISLCTHQQSSRGVDPGDIRGNSAGFACVCSQFLVRDGSSGPLLHPRGKKLRGKTRGVCNIAAIMRLKDNPGRRTKNQQDQIVWCFCGKEDHG